MNQHSEQVIMSPFVHEDIDLKAGLSYYPTTSGQHIVVLESDNLFLLSQMKQDSILSFTYSFANDVKERTGVQRCGLAYDGHHRIHLIPMHGLPDSWEAILAPEVEHNKQYPGYLSTKSSPHLAENDLEDIRQQLTQASQLQSLDQTFHGDDSDQNLFARLIRGEIPQWRFWENQKFIAFLTPFGNTPGASVLIPRKHLPSDIFSLDQKDFLDLMHATQEVVGVLMAGLQVRRVGMFFEGFEIDYTHVKLIPIHGNERAVEGPSDEFHETYPGYITTRLGPRLRGA